MISKTLEFLVGLFVLAGLIALAVLATQVARVSSDSSSQYTLNAKFENIGGLNVKAPVAIGGVRIGRVIKIELDKSDYTAKVILSIDSNYDELPLDTSAAILTSGLLGAQFVGLEPGGEIDFLTEGDEIELTQSTIQLENLIGQFMVNTAEKGGN